MFNPNEKPAYEAPAMACDAHLHIFGKPYEYPYKAELRYKPPIATVDEYKVLANILGIKRMVLVQPSAYGRDNSCQLDAAEQLGMDVCRVIVDIDENISDSELEELHRRGARGVRINVNPVQPLTSGLADMLIPRIKIMEKRCMEIGWNLDFLFPDWLTAEMIPHLSKLRVPFTIAHIGMNKGCHGTSSLGFRKLIDLMKNGDGFCWIKLTASYRISNNPDYSDVIPLAQAVIDAAPERIIWGSDYPHVSFMQHDSIKLFNLLERIAPEEKMRRSILVDNPARLYRFE